MDRVRSSRITGSWIWFGLMLCVSVATAAKASDDELHPKAAPYKDVSGSTQSLGLYGGDGTDFSRNLICGKDDSCSVFGFTNGSFGNTTDFLVLHLTAKADLAWAETFGGTNRDMLYNAIATSDGGYFTSGDSESMFFTGLKIFSPHRDPRPFYVRLDANGKPLWAGNVEVGGDISGAELARSVQTADGGVLMEGSYWEAYPESGVTPMPDEWSGPPVGSTKGWKYSYPLVVRLGADGKPLWMRRYLFGDKGGAATSIVAMLSGHYLIMGSLYTDSTNQLFVMEIDEQGAPVHAQRYELPARLGATASIRLKDGSYAIAGYVNVEKSPPRAFAAMLSPEGKFIVGKIFSDPAGLRPLGMVQAADGRVCIVGRTESGNTNKAEGVAWLVDKAASDTGEFWLTGTGNTELEDVVQLSSGVFRMIGDTDAFGAEGYDLVTANWIPSVGTKRMTSEPFGPKVSDVSATSETGKLDVVRNIPVDLIKVQVLNVTPDEEKD